jgi:hypothetical protein
MDLVEKVTKVRLIGEGSGGSACSCLFPVTILGAGVLLKLDQGIGYRLSHTDL